MQYRWWCAPLLISGWQMTDRPAGVLLISLSDAERSEGDPEDNKALLKWWLYTLKYRVYMSTFSRFHMYGSSCCIGMKQDSVSFHPTLHAYLYFLAHHSMITSLYMFIVTKDFLPLQICHLRLKQSSVCMHVSERNNDVCFCFLRCIKIFILQLFRNPSTLVSALLGEFLK